MTTRIEPFAVALVALAVLACCTSTTAPPSKQQLAEIEKRRAQATDDYLKGLAKTVEAEKRNDTWAAQKESELRSSYARTKGAPPGGLKSVECRSSKCDLKLQVSGEPASKAAIEQKIAINEWISESQPCGYTLTTTGPGVGQTPGAIRIFLDCK
jgi:hypothetical protein